LYQATGLLWALRSEYGAIPSRNQRSSEYDEESLEWENSQNILVFFCVGINLACHSDFNGV